MANDKDDPKDKIGTGYVLRGPLVGSGQIKDKAVIATETKQTTSKK